MKRKKTAVASASTPSSLAEASTEYLDGFTAVLPEMKALRGDQLQIVNVDCFTACTIVIAAYATLVTLRAELAKLPRFDLGAFDKLPLYARALMWTHLLCSSPVAPATELGDLAAACTKHLDDLLVAAQPLLHFKVVPAGSIDGIVRNQGWRQAAIDTLKLTTLFRKHWGSIEHASPVTADTVTAAAGTATKVLDMIALRDQPTPSAVEAIDLRQRAFTLFINAYNPARQGVAYLRAGTGDAERFLPTVFVRNATAPSRATDPAPATTPTTTPVVGAKPATLTSAPDALEAAPVAPPTRIVPNENPFASK